MSSSNERRDKGKAGRGHDIRKTAFEPEADFDIRSTLYVGVNRDAEQVSNDQPAGERNSSTAPLASTLAPPVPPSSLASGVGETDLTGQVAPPLKRRAAANDIRSTRYLPPRPEEAADIPRRSFRPTLRPPMAVLKVLDDDQSSGESFRIRSERFVIGRSEGDVLVAHDDCVSTRHAEIVRESVGGAWRWTLRDLSSANGTFVLVKQVRLKPGDEFLIGACRYQFLAGDPPAIVCVNNQRRTPLGPGEHWIGSGGSAAEDDALLDRKHAVVTLDASGRWFMTDGGSLNGVWVRITQVTLADNCSFQLGEQRFRFYIP